MCFSALLHKIHSVLSDLGCRLIATGCLYLGILDCITYKDVCDPVHRSRVSDAFKLAGNDLQEKKEWDRAKELYSLALQVQPSNIKALSNRALMNLRVRPPSHLFLSCLCCQTKRLTHMSEIEHAVLSLLCAWQGA